MRFKEVFLKNLKLILVKNKAVYIHSLVIILFLGNLFYGFTDAKSQISSDAHIIAIVTAVNQNEISVSELAQKKMTSSLLTDYANMIVISHTENIKMANNLIVSLESGKSETPELEGLEQKSADKLATLNALTGNEFETAYLDAMINGHKEFLNMLDIDLLPMAKSEAVKTYLINTREMVANHLAEANTFIK
ncbi:MAG: DUF4142 domain-containing protein [Ignavibacteria bacterium]|nr:DUF4142 domain-containing protein [Ignavibacteria bacterium]